MNKINIKRNVIIGGLIAAALILVVIVGGEIITGVSGKKINTKEGLELIRKAEEADVTAIETKIKKLEGKEVSGEEESISLKERFASTVIFGDAVIEGFAEYDVLNASSVISGTGMEWEDQVEKLKEVNPKVVFVAYCADDILKRDEDIKAYIRTYRSRIEDVRKALPEATIFINSLQSVSPAAETEEKQYKKLEDYNIALREMCDKLQVGFADNSELPFEAYYEEDGVHFNSGFYTVWAERMAEVAAL